MKIVYITAGAAGMYCGSCLRDNALAAELMAQGHEVILTPLYTPTLTDEPNVSGSKVFFGGISVYLQQYMAVFRNTPWVLDRIWDSSFALKAAARRSIPTSPRLLGELTVSVLKGEEGFQRKEIQKLLEWLRQEAPDVVNLPNSLLISLAKPISRELGIPVCCTLQGEDLFLEGLEEPYRTQALNLVRTHVESVDAFIAVSEYYAEFMSRYLRIPEGKVRVIPVGINLQGHGYGESRGHERFTIGYFARISPEKGLHLLSEAYRIVRREADATLEVAGYLAPEHKPYLAEIERKIKEWGLAGDFRYRGVLDREQKIRFLQNLDVLSVPCTYDEPKGMYVLEAMANGIPVVQPRRGAFPEIIEKTSGGILVDPDDPEALARGLLSIWKDRDLGSELGRRGYAGVRQHYSVTRMAERAAEVYRQLRTVETAQLARS